MDAGDKLRHYRTNSDEIHIARCNLEVACS